MDRPEDILASALLSDADAHEGGRFDEIAERYDDILAELLPFEDSWPPQVSVAFEFWDGWVDARNHDWQYYSGITQEDWPRLARDIARSLREGVEPADPIVMRHFQPRPRRPWRTRVREWFKRRSSESP